MKHERKTLDHRLARERYAEEFDNRTMYGTPPPMRVYWGCLSDDCMRDARNEVAMGEWVGDAVPDSHWTAFCSSFSRRMAY